MINPYIDLFYPKKKILNQLHKKKYIKFIEEKNLKFKTQPFKLI